MHPVLFNVFGLFDLHTYGLMIALGFLIGMNLGAREARRIDLSTEGNFDQFILDLTFWILIAAIAGSRLLYFAVEDFMGLVTAPWKFFYIWEGGLVFYGGLLGAVILSIFYSRRKGRSFLVVADTLIPSVSLGQFFGRIGCYAAGCCWGDPVDAAHPLAVQFPPGSLAYQSMQQHGLIAHDAVASLHVHPVQLYESAGNLTLFFILIMLRTQKRFHGMVLCGYLFLYPFLRFSVEFVRGDAGRGEDMLGTIFSTSQLISLGLFTTGVILAVYGMGQRKKLHAA
ncbi:MAG: prolipoprotein diacylglyceryl transferase [Deltaproteobacteria bacterium]|jgi:phosphatidylglycerol:prolipoprotein diacylglycerol transferase